MPVVNKQNQNQPLMSGNPADRIRSVIEMPRTRITMCVYGQPKTGKTRLLASFPKPVLIIGTEDGTDSVSNVDDVDYFPLRNTGEIPSILNLVNTGKIVSRNGKKSYTTVGLDNCTQAQSMKLSEMLGLEGIPLQHERGVMARIDNQEYSHKTKDMLNEMFKFKGHVVFLCHEREQNNKDSANSSPTSDLIKPYFNASLSKQVSEWLTGSVQHVVQTFIREGKTVIAGDDGSEAVEIGTGKGEYCLRTGPHPVYKAGLRVPVGVMIPDVIVNPTYQKIEMVITGKWKEGMA